MKKFFSKIGTLLKSLLFLKVGLLTYNIIPLLIFEISYKAVTVFCARPFLEWIFSKCMEFAGYSYVNDSNIWEFLCHPISVVTIVFLLILAAIISIIEIGALIFIFENSRQNKKVSMYSIFAYSGKTAIRILSPKNIPIYFYLLLLSPIINIGVSSSFFNGISVPGVFINMIGDTYFSFFIGISIVIISIVLSYRWIYCLQYFCLENDTAFKAFRHSAKLNRSHRVLNFVSMMCIQLAISLINNLFLWISGFVTDFAYNSFSFEHTISEIFGFSVAVIFFVLYVVVYSLFMPLSCLKVCGLYYSNKQASGEGFDKIVINHEKRPDKSGLIDKFRAASKIKIAGVIFVFVLLFGACYTGIDYILTDIIINSQNQTKTKIITSEKNSLSPNIKMLLDAAKSSGADAFLTEVYVSSDGVAYCISQKSLSINLDTFNFKKEENTYEETKNYANSQFNRGQRLNVDDCIVDLSYVLSYAKQIDLPVIVDTSNANTQNFEKSIADTISNSGYSDNIAWCSSNPDSLKLAKHYQKDIPTMYRMLFGRGDFSEVREFCDSIMVDQIFITRRQVNKLHNDGFKVIAWSDSSKKHKIQEACNYGVDYIFVTSAINAKIAINANQKTSFVDEAFGRYAFISLFKDML